jgi:hypothetical protein
LLGKKPENVKAKPPLESSKKKEPLTPSAYSRTRETFEGHLVASHEELNSDNKLLRDRCKKRPETNKKGSGGSKKRDFVPWCKG